MRRIQDVGFRRQILTSKVDPRAERENMYKGVTIQYPGGGGDGGLEFLSRGNYLFQPGALKIAHFIACFYRTVLK